MLLHTIRFHLKVSYLGMVYTQYIWEAGSIVDKYALKVIIQDSICNVSISVFNNNLEFFLEQ